MLTTLAKKLSIFSKRQNSRIKTASAHPERMTSISRFKTAVTALVASCLFIATGGQAFAQGTIIYQDDFEAVPSGWSSNVTEDSPLGGDILGRFDNTPVSRTFTVPAGATSLDIEFDLWRIDSWDFGDFDFNGMDARDGFSVLIDGNPLFSTTTSFGTFPFLDFGAGQGARSGSTGNVD